MFTVKVNEKNEYKITFDKNNVLHGSINNIEFDWDIKSIGKGSNAYHVIKNNKSYNTSVLEVDYEKKTMVISVRGNIYYVSVSDEHDELLKNMGFDNTITHKTNEIKAPMPGLVKSIKISAGDEVKKGDSILILEAMKMENIIKSPVDGVIKSIEVIKDSAVEKNQVLIRFK